jgi:hypothetical protein
MRDVLTLIFQWSMGIIGVLLIYASLSYETEDGKIQNLLELWWVKVDDFKKQALSRHVAFIKTLASVLTAIFNRLFDTRTFSVESLGVSICYSFVCVGLLALLLRKVSANSKLEIPAIASMIAFGAIYGTIPILLRNVKLKFWKITPIHLWFIGLIVSQGWGLWIPLFYIIFIGATQPEARTGVLVILVVVAAFVIAIGLFWIFIGLMRLTVRTISQSQSPMKIVGLLLINLTPLILFFSLIYLAFEMPDLLGRIGIGISITMLVIAFFGMLFNFAFILSAVLFVCLALTMLLHRLFWPAIDRPLYKLQALGISKRPRVFAAIGLILIGASFGKFDWLKSLIDKLS